MNIRTLRGWCFVGSLALLVGSACKTAQDSSAPPVSHFASYGASRVHYTTTGRGPQTVVLIHGWACNGDFWREQLPLLADKARVLVIDLPGHGQSDQPHTNYTMDYFAGAVIAVMNETRVPKATLVGHSMGTPIICRVYQQVPERVAALVAVDGVLRRPKMQPGAADSFLGPFRTPQYLTQTTNFVMAMFPNPGTEALRDWTVSEMVRTPQYVMSSAMDNMFDANAPDWDVVHARVPVLVLNAKNQMWTPDYEAYARSLSDHADYRAIERTGHFLMLEKPAEFNAAFVAMLEAFALIR